ncbi:MAG: hypothetical protein HKL81_01915 [Acidimicrobiaceae bacterium]|nr:hypothetical protein [Acidimicrobiaceae bacterium]
MTRGSASKKVAKAAAAGRTRKIRGEVPIGFYSLLSLVVIAGVSVVWYSRYESQNPKVIPTIQPAVGTTWNAAIGFDVCGKALPNLPAQSATSKLALYTTGNGVITIAPKTKAQAGNAATLGAFVSGYKGLSISGSGFSYPGKGSYSSTTTCGGKPAVYGVYSWSSLLATSPTKILDPATHKFSNDELLSIAVLPKGTKPTKPASEVALINQAATNTTTTTSVGSATTVAPTTSTTKASTATTKAPTKSSSAG